MGQDGAHKSLPHRAARVVALTDAAAAEMERRYHVPTEKLAVIPNGASATVHRPCTPADRAAARRALGLAGDATVLVVIGALSSEKGVDIAISAIAALPSVQLVVVGDGPERGALERPRLFGRARSSALHRSVGEPWRGIRGR